MVCSDSANAAERVRGIDPNIRFHLLSQLYISEVSHAPHAHGAHDAHGAEEYDGDEYIAPVLT
jgi:hypothetical protein